MRPITPTVVIKEVPKEVIVEKIIEVSAKAVDPQAVVASVRPVSTAQQHYLKLTEEQIIDVVREKCTNMAFKRTKNVNDFSAYAAEKFPVEMILFKSAAGDVTEVAFVVNMADFVELATVNKRLDPERLDELTRQVMDGPNAVGNSVEPKWFQAKDLIKFNLSECMADRMKREEVLNHETYVVTERASADGKVTVSLNICAKKPRE